MEQQQVSEPLAKCKQTTRVCLWRPLKEVKRQKPQQKKLLTSYYRGMRWLDGTFWPETLKTHASTAESFGKTPGWLCYKGKLLIPKLLSSFSDSKHRKAKQRRSSDRPAFWVKQEIVPHHFLESNDNKSGLKNPNRICALFCVYAGKEKHLIIGMGWISWRSWQVCLRLPRWKMRFSVNV